MYYLQSRYYNPTWGRFINADASASTGQGSLGNNMFVYCLNSPVNGCDPCGTCFHRWDFWNDCEKCGGRTLGDKVNGAIKWCADTYSAVKNYVNSTNTAQIQTDLSTRGVAFYDGIPVFMAKLPFDKSAFSFGVIVMDDFYGIAGYDTFSETLKHESGHSRHYQMVGPLRYAFTVAAPSLSGAGLSYICPFVKENYYNQPWERIADALGDINRQYAPGANTLGSLYFYYTLMPLAYTAQFWGT